MGVFCCEDEIALKRHMKSSCFRPCCQSLVDQCLLPLPISTIRLNHSVTHRRLPPIPVSAIRSNSEHKVTKCNVAYKNNKILPLRYYILYTTHTSLPRVPRPNFSHFDIQSCQSIISYILKCTGASDVAACLALIGLNLAHTLLYVCMYVYVYMYVCMVGCMYLCM